MRNQVLQIDNPDLNKKIYFVPHLFTEILLLETKAIGLQNMVYFV